MSTAVVVRVVNFRFHPVASAARLKDTMTSVLTSAKSLHATLMYTYKRALLKKLGWTRARIRDGPGTQARLDVTKAGAFDPSATSSLSIRIRMRKLDFQRNVEKGRWLDLDLDLDLESRWRGLRDPDCREVFRPLARDTGLESFVNWWRVCARASLFLSVFLFTSITFIDSTHVCLCFLNVFSSTFLVAPSTAALMLALC